MQRQCWWIPRDCQSLMRPVSPATLLQDAWRWYISHAETGTFYASFFLSSSLIPFSQSENHNYGGICSLLSNRLQVRDKGQAWSKNYQRGNEKSFQDETCIIQVCLSWQCWRRGLVTQSRLLASHILLRVCLLSCFRRVWLFVTLCTIARQTRLSMGFSRQGYWSGLPCPPPGDLPNLGIKPASLTSPALAGKFFTTGTTWEAHILLHHQTTLQWSLEVLPFGKSRKVASRDHLTASWPYGWTKQVSHTGLEFLSATHSLWDCFSLCS